MRHLLIAVLAAGIIAPQTSVAQGIGGSKAFAAEAAGGVLGSAAGVVLGLAVSKVDDCDVEDLECTIKGLGVAGVGSVIGSTAGVLLGGRSVKSRPSGIGALIGSLAGVAAGVALVHGMTEEVNLKLDKPTTIIVYSLAQGVLSAAGSRLGAALR